MSDSRQKSVFRCLNICHIRFLCRQFLRHLGFNINGPTNWLKMRKLALKRDNYTCQTCGLRSRKKMTVHHLNENHEDNRLENLLTLCRPCHDIVHNMQPKECCIA